MRLEHDILVLVTPERSASAESFLVPRVNVLPTELVFQVVGEGLLDEAVFAVKRRDQSSSGSSSRTLVRFSVSDFSVTDG